jgi:phenylalanine-4-hydroxylase
VRSPEPRRVAFDLQRLMRTRYKIDSFQSTYFVIDAFQQLFDATAPDFTPVYAQVRAQAEIEAGSVLSGEREFAAG